jgi:DNA repair protein RadC
MMQFEMPSPYQVREVELIYRHEACPEVKPYINKSEIAYEVLKASWDENRIELVEQFKIILLDFRNNCLGISEISTGGMAACLVDPKIVFATALKARASKIIGAHNHPSGSLNPSKADIEITRKLVAGGQLLDIQFEDHLILTSQGYYSLADNGLIP